MWEGGKVHPTRITKTWRAGSRERTSAKKTFQTKKIGGSGERKRQWACLLGRFLQDLIALFITQCAMLDYLTLQEMYTIYATKCIRNTTGYLRNKCLWPSDFCRAWRCIIWQAMKILWQRSVCNLWGLSKRGMITFSILLPWQVWELPLRALKIPPPRLADPCRYHCRRNLWSQLFYLLFYI